MARKKGEHERPKLSEALDKAFVVYERYNQQKDVFSKFHKLKYRYIANFGKKAEQPFQIVNEVINQIFQASRRLGTNYWQSEELFGMTEEQISKHYERMEKLEEIFWEESQTDELNTKLDLAISICEEICKSANNFGLWNFFQRYR